MDAWPVKLVVGGDGGVGKTTYLYRYCKGEFIMDTKLTVGVSFLQKTTQVDGKTFAVAIWDLGGQEQFRFILQNYCRGAQGGMVFFALDRYASFLNLPEWINMFRSADPNLPLILVGARADLELDTQKIGEDEINEIVARYNMVGYIRTSSKTGENIEEPINMILKKVMQRADSC
ncbi:MAG: Rab family GTPase [Promethearchaeota archaeon]